MIRGPYEPKSNRESFVDYIELYSNGVQLDLTGVTAKVQLELTPEYCQPTGYLTYFGYGASNATKLLATIEIVASAAIRFTFTLAQMVTLQSGQYKLSATATSADGSMTIQLFQFQIPILDGGVPTS